MSSMFSRTARILLATTACVVFAAGCTEDLRDASFSSATDTQRTTAIDLARGLHSAHAMLASFAAELDSSMYGCPRVEQRDDATGYIGGGCTTPDGSVYDGEMWLTNVPSFADLFESTVDPSQPMKLVFTDFSMTREGTVFAVDGRIEQSSPEPVGAYATLFDLSGTLAGVDFWLYQEFACTAYANDGGSLCNFAGDSAAGIAGLGSFSMRGQLVSPTVAGVIYLEGSDVLHVYLDEGGPYCAPYTIDDGVSNQYCYDAPPTDGE